MKNLAKCLFLPLNPEQSSAQLFYWILFEATLPRRPYKLRQQNTFFQSGNGALFAWKLL
jgi:hypothetical protein